MTVLTPTLPREELHIRTERPLGDIRAVCLDVDDTLVDHGRSARAGLAALTGHDQSWPQWLQLTERHYQRFIGGEVDFDTMRLQRTMAFFAELGEPLTEAEAADREARRMAAMRRAWRLFDDVEPCLHLLHAAGFMLAVVTNAASHYQRNKLMTVGLIDTFDVLVIAEEVGTAKPDPEIFHIACRQLRVRPHQAVHVGDRIDLDAEGAVRAGLTGVWLDRTGAGCSDLPADIHVINDLVELPDLIAQL